MGLNVKLGKGGHGLEVYDEEGKYADEFSFQVEGQEIKGYDDFRSLCFASLAKDSAGQYDVAFLDNLYNTNPNFKEQMDSRLYPEYNQMLEQAVNEYNQRTQVWNSPKEAAEHVHELFVPSLVQNLLDNDILGSSSSKVTKSYEVSTLAACLQMSRYSGYRMKNISRKGYEEEMSSNKAQGNLSYFSNTKLEDYISDAIKNKKSIPIHRGIYGVASGDEQTVYNSFFDNSSPRHSCLASYGVGYYGSVIYFQTGGRSDYGGLSINGFVKMNDKMRLLNCPLSEGSRIRCRQNIKEVVDFQYAVFQDPNFDKRFIEQLKQNPNIDDAKAQNILNRLKYEIRDDTGFCGILMGYDAIYGSTCQFDILNPTIATIVERE